MVDGSGLSRGDRNRNGRLGRLRELLPAQNAIVGIDLADAKQGSTAARKLVGAVSVGQKSHEATGALNEGTDRRPTHPPDEVRQALSS